ncbi:MULTISPECIES: M57 family metalloprotease [Leeuwenhoekiella]|jgi:hypothetical protein|nr:M57 family metalloprotease [Leeuwenhoekiella blandensis]MAO42271.1 hypothetical protein [Leeuwenhoekiella sp.]MBQ52395.1 hypothetical protein [Leeuwenhoekiella sp.]HCW63604.1 hypothetical protein [Leeuwenhoekiella sp.]|tara:strand:- start:6749 stop:7834 length:1086 start_codon:yes stop_codon:yes gene_type:complete
MMKNRYLLILFTSSILINGCSIDQDNTLSNSENIEYLDVIKSNVSIPVDTFDFENYIVIEGDIMIPKEKLFSKNQSKQFSWKNDSLVSKENINNITIYVDNSIPSSGTDNWRIAVQEAANLWNSLEYQGTSSQINISYSNSTNSDIIVRSDYGQLQNGTIAMGSVPIGCNVGSTIIINLDFYNNYNVPHSKKVYNMVHEIGHNIGFGHTNSPNTWYLQKIVGTPDTDSNSVMNGGTALNSWDGFSIYDEKATLWLYDNIAIKYPKEGDELVSGSGDWSTSWTPHYFCQEDYVNIKVYFDQFGSGNEVLRINENVKNDGSWYYPSGKFGGGNNDNDGNFRLRISSIDNPNNFFEVNFNMFVD